MSSLKCQVSISIDSKQLQLLDGWAGSIGRMPCGGLAHTHCLYRIIEWVPFVESVFTMMQNFRTRVSRFHTQSSRVTCNHASLASERGPQTTKLFMAVFDGVRYILSSSLPPSRRNELASILDLNGATTAGPHTHLIALGGSYSHKHSQGEESPNSALKVVSDKWVDRSIVMGKLQLYVAVSPAPTLAYAQAA